MYGIFETVLKLQRQRSIESVLRRRDWKRSRNGNPTRIWREHRLTIFGDEEGGYGWTVCIGDDPPSFSPERYESRAEARLSLAYYLSELYEIDTEFE